MLSQRVSVRRFNLKGVSKLVRHSEGTVLEAGVGVSAPKRESEETHEDTATEHVARMHQIAAILERYGYSVTLLCEARIGYVVWEDEFQVIAERFADTQTG